MKKYIKSIIFITIALNGISQKKIKQVEIDEIGFDVKLNFEAEKNELNNEKLKLKITPLSTASLNEKFLYESGFNGKFQYSNYEKSRNSYFLKKTKRKRIKSDYEFLIEGIDWLLSNNRM